jgi:acetyltransferase EpsM
MKKRLIIIGAGYHGKEVAAYCRDMQNEIELLGFIDEKKARGTHTGSEILGSWDALKKLAAKSSDLYYLTATGDNRMRASFVKKVEALGLKNLKPFTLKHVCSHTGPQIEIGEGTCLAPGTIVTCDSRIGRHCILNVKVSVSHDCEIGDYVNLNPGATICGNVKIGEGSYIGAAATVIDKVKIGRWAVIGAGAVVIEDLPDAVTAAGVPARIIRRLTVPVR